jgi:ABC-2 type transport system ATP-binding protein
VVIDNGTIIAEGTSDTLKKRVGTDLLELVIAEITDFERAKKAISDKNLRADNKRRTLSLTTKDGIDELQKVLTVLKNAKITVESASLHRPTLDDVFLTLTGHHAVEETEDSETNQKGKKNG